MFLTEEESKLLLEIISEATRLSGKIEEDEQFYKDKRQNFTMIKGGKENNICDYKQNVCKFKQLEKRKNFNNKIIENSANPKNKGDAQLMKYNRIKVVKRKDNRFFARITINGKQKSIYGKTQMQCYENLKAEVEEITSLKEEISFKNIKLFWWIEEWFKTYKTPKLKKGSLYQIRNCIDNHIKPNILDYPLNKIKPVFINNALNKIKSSRMRKYTYDCYVECLREAYKNQLIKINISEMIDKVIHIRKKGRSLDNNERKIFFESTKKIKYGKIFEFMLLSGCRPQGAQNLKWEDIKENKIFINETKSKNGQRFIPYFDNLKTLLKSIEPTSDKVFPISETTIKKNFQELKNLCGFNFTQKDLRHTFATRCGEIGIDDMTLAKWLGHGNPSTTKQYYREIMSDFEATQAELLNKNFTKKIDTNFDTNFDTKKS